MGEIVKQLFTSPIADSPSPFPVFRFQTDGLQPVKRLDAALGGSEPDAAHQTAADGTAQGKPKGKSPGRRYGSLLNF